MNKHANLELFPSMTPEFQWKFSFTVYEAIAMLGICRATLYKGIKAGNIETSKHGSRTKISKAELLRIAENGFKTK